MLQSVSSISDRGQQTVVYLESNGFVASVPGIRSHDADYLSNPFFYYLRRRLGLTTAFSESDALRHGRWFHKRHEQFGKSPGALEAGLEDAIDEVRTRIATAADATNTGDAYCAAVLDSERKAMQTASAWYEASATFNVPGNEWLSGGWHSIYNRPGWRTLAYEVVISIHDRRWPKTRLIAQFDTLVYDEINHVLWIDDLKTTSRSPKLRAATCKFSHQTRHYLYIAGEALPNLIATFGLAPDTVIGGLRHIIIRKPPIRFSLKDRSYTWASEGKRSGRAGSAFYNPKGGDWIVVSLEHGEHKRLGAFANEAEAMTALHEFTGKAPWKEYFGEPNFDAYKQRCVEWYHGLGEYAAETAERQTDPPVNIHFTTLNEGLDAPALTEYLQTTTRVYRMAVQPPLPIYFPRTESGLDDDDAKPYLDLFNIDPIYWPDAIKQNKLIVESRERPEWLTSSGILAKTEPSSALVHH